MRPVTRWIKPTYDHKRLTPWQPELDAPCLGLLWRNGAWEKTESKHHLPNDGETHGHLTMVFRIPQQKNRLFKTSQKKSFSQETEDMFLAKFVVPRNLFSDQTPEKKELRTSVLPDLEVQDTSSNWLHVGLQP